MSGKLTRNQFSKNKRDEMSFEVEKEIEKLRNRKVVIVNRMNTSVTIDEKEEYEKELESIQKQIGVLERLRK